jgi:mannose-6-phosphate isomerase-like protein (cupin superfamily)
MDQMISGDDLPYVVSKDELAFGTTAHRFEGYRYGGVNASFFLVESPPGGGARLHFHPYEEIFITLEGEATFTVGDEIIEAKAGQIVVAPAKVPHKFTNTGTDLLRQVDIHPSSRIQQTNVEEGA